MKERVYVNRVAVDYEALYARAKDYFHRHGVEIDFEFVQTDYQNLSYIKRQFPQGERIILQPYMAQVVLIDDVYDFTSFVFNGREFPPPNIPTGYTYCPVKQPFMDILTDELNGEDLDYVTICHEHMHALVILARQKNFNVPDVMDTYYKAMQLESADSNFGQQWALLKNYVRSLQKPLEPKKVFIKKEKIPIKIKIPKKPNSIVSVVKKPRRLKGSGSRPKASGKKKRRKN